jgi:hypothetical protein
MLILNNKHRRRENCESHEAVFLLFQSPGSLCAHHERRCSTGCLPHCLHRSVGDGDPGGSLHLFHPQAPSPPLYVLTTEPLVPCP